MENIEKNGSAVPEFKDFYSKYYDQVYWYIFKKINNIEDSQDLAGDVFSLCLKHYSKYDPEKSSLSTWLYVIVNNRLKNYYRDRKVFVPLDENIDAFMSDSDDYATEALYLEDSRNMLADAISSLPKNNQLIIILKFFGEKQSHEIADILHMSPTNVRVSLSRSLKKIQNYFTSHGWNGEI
ncbi:MAG: sigma-70 family RNA polymerase sigma factor [Oscillospiraceae bacterium]|nr:sigma-70 family RNA polymerase sigma factor [Oscillospiraceae bacterium]